MKQLQLIFSWLLPLVNYRNGHCHPSSFVMVNIHRYISQITVVIIIVHVFVCAVGLPIPIVAVTAGLRHPYFSIPDTCGNPQL